MRLRARSPEMQGQVVAATLVAGWKRSPGFPMLLADGNLRISLEAALATYEVIDADAAERQVLQRWGHPFGGVQ